MKTKVGRIAGLVRGGLALGLGLLLGACPAPLTRESITAERIRSHVAYLASDSLRGRKTGTDGIAAAERYVASWFRRIGLAPPPRAPDYYLDFSLFEYGLDAAASRLIVSVDGAVRRGVVEEDFVPLPLSAPGLAQGELVYAGYGISAPERGYDDYAGIDARGRIVVAFRHEPESFSVKRANGGIKYSRHALYTAKVENAVRHGARAVLFVTDPFFFEREGENLKAFARLSLFPDDSAAEASSASEHSLITNDENYTPAAIPAFQVSAAIGACILESSGQTPAALQHALEKGEKPGAFRLSDSHALLFSRRRPQPLEIKARNVAGLLPGTDEKLRDRWIVVGAHHDHIGSFTGEGDTIYNGADDNASGVSGVLELSAALSGGARRPRHSLLFITFSAEEEGLFGSDAVFLRELLPLDNLARMVNLDMIGRNPGVTFEVLVRERNDPLTDAAKDFFAGRPGGVETVFSDEREALSDDFQFNRRGVPTFFFFSGLHRDYHGVDDEADRLEYAALEERVRLVYDFILFLDNQDQDE